MRQFDISVTDATPESPETRAYSSDNTVDRVYSSDGSFQRAYSSDGQTGRTYRGLPGDPRAVAPLAG